MIELKAKSIEEDHLTFLLYNSSKSEKTKKQLRNSKIIPPLLFLTISILNYFQDKNGLVYGFIILAILWYFLYPIRLKNNFRKHFETHIKEKLADEIGQESKVTLDKNELIILSDDGNSNLKTSIAVSLIELQNMFIIMLKGSKGIIINKSINEEALGTELKDWAASIGIEYKNELDWKWK